MLFLPCLFCWNSKYQTTLFRTWACWYLQTSHFYCKSVLKQGWYNRQADKYGRSIQTVLDMSRNLSKLRLSQTFALLNKFYALLLKKVIEPIQNKQPKVKHQRASIWRKFFQSEQVGNFLSCILHNTAKEARICGKEEG